MASTVSELSTTTTSSCSNLLFQMRFQSSVDEIVRVGSACSAVVEVEETLRVVGEVGSSENISPMCPTSISGLGERACSLATTAPGLVITAKTAATAVAIDVLGRRESRMFM